MKLSALLLSLMAITAPQMFAKDEMRTFERPSDQVFTAAIKVASEHGAIIFSDKENRILTFKSGGYWNKGFEVQVKVEDAGSAKSLVKVLTQKTYFGAGWGAASRITKDFFSELDKALNYR